MDNNQNDAQQNGAQPQGTVQQQYDAQQQYYQQQYEMQQQYYQQLYEQQQAQQNGMQQQYYQQQAQQNDVQQQYAQQQQYMQQPQQQYAQQQQYMQQPQQQYAQQQYIQPQTTAGNSDGGASGGNGKGKKTGLIIGIIAAVVILAATIITIVVVKNKKKDKDDKKNDKTTEAVTTDDTETTEATTEEVSSARYFSLSKAYDSAGNDYTEMFLDNEQYGLHSFIYLDTSSYTGYVYISGEYTADIDDAEFDVNETYLISGDFNIILRDDKITFSDKAGEMTLEFTEITADEYAVIEADTFGNSGGQTEHTGEFDYTPDDPVIYSDDVVTVEIVNIHRYNPDEYYKDDAMYSWDVKITNNRKKGGIYVDFLNMQYNNVVIGGRHLNNDSPLGVGQTREINIPWLDFVDNYRFFGDAMSCKFTLHIEDDDYNDLMDVPVEFYTDGPDNDISAVPDLSGYTPFLEYEGLKFYVTDTYLDEYDYIMMEGFLVNESDRNYYLYACYNDDIYVNGVTFDRADRIHMDAPAHTTTYFQGWICMDEEYGPENGFNISIPYTIYDMDTDEEYVPEQQYSFSMPYKKEEASEDEIDLDEYNLDDYGLDY